MRSALALAMLCLLPFNLLAEDEDLAQKLAHIQVQVSDEEAKLSTLEAKEKELEDNLLSLRADVKRLGGEEQALRKKVDLLSKRKTELQLEVQANQVRIAELKEAFRRRLRALYSNPDAGLLESLLGSGSLSSFQENAFLLSRIQRRDRALADELRSAIQANTLKQKELDSLVKEHQTYLGKLNLRKADLTAKIAAQNKVNSRLAEEKANIQSSLASLQAQALRLESVVLSLTQVEPVQKPEDAEPQLAERPESGFVGKGLQRQKGALVLPVRGVVVQAYGKHRVKSFKDFVFNKGLEFKSESGAEVKAVADGKVIHLGRMPGYGTLLILDHGERYYSLYARLGDVGVKRGDLAEKGQVIGKTSEPDERERNFYFELRRNGSPVNPQEYFSKL